jgi:hypothetical protein
MLLLLAFAVLLNGGLFAYAQKKDAYGLSAYSSSAYTLLYGDVEDDAYLTAYTDLLEQVRGKPLQETADVLTARNSLLSQAGTFILLWQNTDLEDQDSDAAMDYCALYERFLELYPNLESMLAQDTASFRTQAYVDSVAVTKLLAQIDYLQGYSAYLEGIQTSATQMLRFSIFNSGFTERSILKTAADFSALEGVEVQLANTLPIEAFLRDRYTDFFLLVLLLFTALRLLQERKANLWPVVHAAPNGRLRLVLKRFAVLAICTVVFVVCLYGSILLESVLLFRADWSIFSVSAQSVEALEQFPTPCTLAGLFLRLLFFRILTAFVIAAVLWLLLSLFPQGKTMLIAATVVLMAEYGLYAYLSDNRAWNLLKYCNLFCLLFSTETYSTYLNLNVLQYPVGVRTIGMGLTAVLGILSLASCALLQCKKRPYGGNLQGHRLELRLRKASNAVCSRLGGVGFALYQSLILRHGLLVVVCFFVFCFHTSYAVSLQHSDASAYYAALEGPVSAETYDALEKLCQENADDIAQADLLQEQWAAGELSFQAYFTGIAQYGGAYSTAETLSEVRERIDALAEASGGQCLWVLDSTAFDEIYGENAERLQTGHALALLLAMCLLFSGAASFEKQANMTTVARATGKGRTWMLLTQYAVVMLEVLVLCAVQDLLTYRELRSVTYLSAPVQSIAWLANFPLRVSVRGFVAIRFAYRYVVCASLGCMMLAFGSAFPGARTAEVCTLFVTVVPSLLALYFGVSTLRFVAVALPIIGLSWLWRSNGEITTAMVVGGILLAASSIMLLWNLRRRRRSWN